MKRIIAVLKYPRRINDFIAYAKSVVANLSADPIFAPLPSWFPELEAQILALEAANVATLTRRRGLATAREAARARVLGGLLGLRSFVQTVADAHPGQEVSITLRAGMAVKNTRGPSKGLFQVGKGPVPRSAHARARAAKTRASYEWQYSLDGEHWRSAPSTVGANTIVYDLAPATFYQFRYRVSTKDGASDWCDPVVFLVE